MGSDRIYFESVRTKPFEDSAKGILGEEEIRRLEEDLVLNPRAGDVIVGTGGVRKTRVAVEGRGKRGGARVAYLYLEVRERIYLLYAFAKNEQANLTADEKKQVRARVAQIKEEN